MYFYRSKIIRLQIISGQNLPKIESRKKKVIDPYVTIRVLGHSIDRQKFKTKHVDDNGEMCIYVNKIVNLIYFSY